MKHLLLIFIFSISQMSFAAKVPTDDVAILASLISDKAFISKVQASFANELPTEAVSLSSIRWVMTKAAMNFLGMTSTCI